MVALGGGTVSLHFLNESTRKKDGNWKKKTEIKIISAFLLVQMRAADAKAAKTTSNLGTKFQQTQQMWSRPTRSMTQVERFVARSSRSLGFVAVK